MKRTLTATLVTCLLLLGWSLSGRAADTIYLKSGKPAKLVGIIESESARGVQLKKQKDVIPSEDIQDIEYDVPSTTLRLEVVNPALSVESKALKTPEAQRAVSLGVAIDRYQSILPKVDPKLVFLRRHIQYRMVHLQVLKSELERTETARSTAIGKLKEFKTNNPDCWQLPATLVALARLQVEQKDYEGAEETLKALAAAPVSDNTRQDAEFRVVGLSMQGHKYKEAIPKLEALIAKLPPDSPYIMRARLAEAECLALTKDLKAAQDRLQKILGESKEGDVRAAAYNTLGYCYLQDNQLDDARWAFLWVDVVYNQNKAEHAKALYYLSKVFLRKNQPDRADACLQTLLNDQQLEGLEYQVKAVKEKGR